MQKNQNFQDISQYPPQKYLTKTRIIVLIVTVGILLTAVTFGAVKIFHLNPFDYSQTIQSEDATRLPLIPSSDKQKIANNENNTTTANNTTNTTNNITNQYHLKVEVAPDTPSWKNGVIVGGNYPVARFKLTATNSDIYITSITIKNKSNISCSEQVSNLNLYDGTSKSQLYSYIQSLDKDCYGTFKMGDFLIPKGENKILSLVIDIPNNKSILGSTFAFQISDVGIEPKNKNIDGIPTKFANTMTIVGNILMAWLNPTTPASTEINAGQQNFNFTRIVLAPKSNETIKIELITITKTGTASDKYIDRVKLFDSEGHQIGSDGYLSNNKAIFNNLNLILSRNSSKILFINADINSYIPEEKTVILGIENSSHISALDYTSGGLVRIEAIFPLNGNPITIKK